MAPFVEIPKRLFGNASSPLQPVQHSVLKHVERRYSSKIRNCLDCMHQAHECFGFRYKSAFRPQSALGAALNVNFLRAAAEQPPAIMSTVSRSVSCATVQKYPKKKRRDLLVGKWRAQCQKRTLTLQHTQLARQLSHFGG